MKPISSNHDANKMFLISIFHFAYNLAKNKKNVDYVKGFLQEIG